MSITGPGSVTAANVTMQSNIMNQLNTLAQELGTGESAQTYSGLQAQSGISVALDAQLAAIKGYGNTTTTVSTTLGVAQSALTQINSTAATVQQEVTDQPSFN